MATGQSGSITVSLASYNKGTGYATFYWREDYDYNSWTSTVTIYKVVVQHSTYHGKWKVGASIAVNGTTIGSMSSDSYYGQLSSTGSSAEVLYNGTTSVSFTSGAIAHDAAGTKSVTLAITGVSMSNSAYGWSMSGGSKSETITLTDLSTVHTHSYTSTITKQPTCVATGTRKYTCSCGASYTETIAATGVHSYADATCTKPKTCTVCGGTTGSALGHNYIDSIILPTCTDQGYTRHTCSRCSSNYIDTYVSALGHSWDGTSCTACGASSIMPYKRICYIFDGEKWVKNFVYVSGKRRVSHIYKDINGNPENAMLGFAVLGTMKLGEGA